MWLLSVLIMETSTQPAVEQQIPATLFACNYCNRRFKSRSGARGHVRAKHYKDLFPCIVCGRIYSYTSNLHRHFDVHRRNFRVESLPKISAHSYGPCDPIRGYVPCPSCHNLFISDSVFEYHFKHFCQGYL